MELKLLFNTVDTKLPISIKQILMLILLFVSTQTFSQSTLVAELFGNPINYNGWTTAGSTLTNNGDVLLTPAQTGQAGAIYYDQPYSIGSCKRFRVRFEYLMEGGAQFSENGISSTGDGIAFWFLENPPVGLVNGSSLGMPNTGSSANNRGLKVGLDIYDNDGKGNNPAVSAFWGGNFQEGDGREKSVSVANLRGNQYKNCEILWDNGVLTVIVDGVTVMNSVSLTAFDNAQNIAQGYFGFSASTGLATDRQSIKNAQIFLDVIPVNDISMQGCFTEGEDTGIINMNASQIRNQIAASGSFRFFNSLNDATRNRNRILTPEAYLAKDDEVVYVRVENTAGCYSIATITVDLIRVEAVILDPPIPICASKPIELDGSASIGNNLVYSWTNNKGQIISGENTSKVTILGPGTYTLTVASGICVSETSIRIDNNQLTPRIEIVEPPQISCLNPSITIDASLSETGANITYLWTTKNGNIVSGANTLSPVVNMPGTYSLFARDSNQDCSNNASIKVTESSDVPVSTFDLPELKTCKSFEVQLDGSASSSGANITYQWEASDGGVIVSGQNTNTATVSAEGTYTLVVTNTDSGCPARSRQTLLADTTKPEAIIKKPADILSCTKPTVQLDGRDSSRGTDLVYLWSLDGVPATGENNSLTYTASLPGEYTFRVTNTITGCSSFDTVTVTKNDNSIDFDLPEQVLLSCSSDPTIIDGSGSTNRADLTYQWTTEDGRFVGATNALTVEVSAIGTYTLTISNPAADCSRSQSVLVVRDPSSPVIAPFYQLEQCSDIQNNGFSTFNLRSKDVEIANGQNNVSINYYLTAQDALNRQNPLPDVYDNVISPIQSIFVRVENNDTNCASITNLDLLVAPIPSPRVTEPFIVCDPDADGFEVFDLSTLNEKIIDADPEVTLSYHDTENNAENNLFPLDLQYSNISRNQQTIFVRATNNRTQCYKVASLELIARPAPQINFDIEDLEICDDDNDGFATFNLTEKDNEVSADINQNEIRIQYFTTEANAISGRNAIQEPGRFRNSVTGQQTIWARSTNIITDCFRYTQFNIVVNTAPVAQVLPPITECDLGNNQRDGVTAFDLSQAALDIVNNQLGYQVKFYTTQEAAETGGNNQVSLTNFNNTTNPQILYARINTIATNCVGYGNILLRVTPNPSPEIPTALEMCDINGTGDGVEVFNLLEKEIAIENQEGGVTLTYFENIADAEENTNPILTPETYQNTKRDNQTLYVRATNNTTSCFSVVPMEIVVNPLPESDDFVPMTVCAIPDSVNGIFDLSKQDNIILKDITNKVAYQVTYHLNDADAIANVRQLPDLYRSAGRNQTIYARVEHIASECFMTNSFDLTVGDEVVLTRPTEALKMCGEVEGNIRVATFNLNEMQNRFLGDLNATDFTISYFETSTNGVLSNPIDTPASYTNTKYPQNIYVQVQRNVSPNCKATTQFELLINLNPEPVLVQNQILCVDEITQEPLGIVNLNSGLLNATHDFVWTLNGQIIAGQNQATLMANQPGIYEVTATKKGTGCFATANTTIIPSSKPIANYVYLNPSFSGSGSVQIVSENPDLYFYALDDKPEQDSPLFENLSPGTYVITVRDKNGCGNITLDVPILDYMRFFTPNGDSYNDDWKITGLEEKENARVWIFDRNGKLIKEMKTTDKWNGTLNGSPLPSTDYWFKVEYEDEGQLHEFKSHFSLKR